MSACDSQSFTPCITTMSNVSFYECNNDIPSGGKQPLTDVTHKYDKKEALSVALRNAIH